ncbi:hypothetical protein D3C87_1920950 [compost metagenome]
MFQPRGHFVLAPVGLVHYVLVGAQQVHRDFAGFVRQPGHGCNALHGFHALRAERVRVVDLRDLAVCHSQQAVSRGASVSCGASQVLGYRLQVVRK